MTKTICDICHKEMPYIGYENKNPRTADFCIVSKGFVWDICSDCQHDLDELIEKKRNESAE